MKRFIGCLMIAAVVGMLSACSDALVRVKPFEREYFAQEKMLFSPMAAGSEFEEHIFSVREGSQGGAVSFQGGCGCR